MLLKERFWIYNFLKFSLITENCVKQQDVLIFIAFVFFYGKKKLYEELYVFFYEISAIYYLKIELFCVGRPGLTWTWRGWWRLRGWSPCGRPRRGRAASSAHSQKVRDTDQLESGIQVTWPVVTNQRAVYGSPDLCWPIRSQYLGHVICLEQSEVRTECRIDQNC